MCSSRNVFYSSIHLSMEDKDGARKKSIAGGGGLCEEAAYTCSCCSAWSSIAEVHVGPHPALGCVRSFGRTEIALAVADLQLVAGKLFCKDFSVVNIPLPEIKVSEVFWLPSLCQVLLLGRSPFIKSVPGGHTWWLGCSQLTAQWLRLLDLYREGCLLELGSLGMFCCGGCAALQGPVTLVHRTCSNAQK